MSYLVMNRVGVFEKGIHSLVGIIVICLSWSESF